ncbi:4Fe-4S dicluster domain-containing protein [Sebaldella sp. S0638]|uniref:4Fe-4S dicluster domain-containing protein n=1 Tax=Sebaldella sp. S0638 TaxID=2957809 RepID=UPI0020A16383|nr:4Fe-4S dicluster domain-containing protein [Sebaldella sp. S0638]MCP1223750.1 SLBB domain-containing protein [Sebaldella sp. S0638]
MNFLDAVYNAGVVGAGGAGFPTHMKMTKEVGTFIVNGAECEPLLEVDKFLMRDKTYELIKGMEIIAGNLKADRVVLGLKKKYKAEIKKLSDTIIELDSRVELFLMENFYPAGDEQIMVKDITGKSIPAGGIPLDVDAVVSNVGTVINVYEAIEEKPVTKKYVSVLGEVNNPIMLEVPIGTPFEECIKRAGGTKIKNYAIIEGGPMMGKIVHKEELAEKAVIKTTGALIILPEDHYVIKRKERPVAHILNESRAACIQCRMCTDMCPRYLIGHKLRPHRVMRAMGMGEEDEEVLMEALICCECNVCELFACPMGISPKSTNTYLKGVFREKGVRYTGDKEIPAADEMRDYRKIPVNRLIARLNLSKYYNNKISDLQELKADKVRIFLSQHIGKPAVPLVKEGDRVIEGQRIAEVGRDEFGANIHASINGVVSKIEKLYIEIDGMV